MSKRCGDQPTEEQVLKAFEPCDRIKEENLEARAAGKVLIAEGVAAGPKRRTFIFVNNRLEGNAISTIEAILQTGSLEVEWRSREAVAAEPGWREALGFARST